MTTIQPGFVAEHGLHKKPAPISLILGETFVLMGDK